VEGVLSMGLFWPFALTSENIAFSPSTGYLISAAHFHHSAFVWACADTTHVDVSLVALLDSIFKLRLFHCILEMIQSVSFYSEQLQRQVRTKKKFVDSRIFISSIDCVKEAAFPAHSKSAKIAVLEVYGDEF